MSRLKAKIKTLRFGGIVYITLLCLLLVCAILGVELKDRMADLIRAKDSAELTQEALVIKNNSINDLEELIKQLEASVSAFENRDEYLINQELKNEIGEINRVYKKTVDVYEELITLRDDLVKTENYEKLLAKAVVKLANREYASAEAELKGLSDEIENEKERLAAEKAKMVAEQVVQAVVESNPPTNGYRRQVVNSEAGAFVVDIVAADLSTTKVIVDTASESDCGNECPVLSLGDYVGRNGAFAGVNGSYFCPASYPSCVGKSNSFDTLVMNKNKVYFNSDNNVYSTVPAVIFGNGWIRFVSQSLQWGRDTSVDGVLANQPLLVADGNVVFGGDGDPKKGSKSNRSFVSNKGNMVYIGVVRNATVAESARVMKALGMENALNLDAGGSTALWSGGYKAGPGRNIPNAILFVSK